MSQELDIFIAERVFGLEVKQCAGFKYHGGDTPEEPGCCANCGRESFYLDDGKCGPWAVQPAQDQDSWPSGTVFRRPIEKYSTDPVACSLVKAKMPPFVIRKTPKGWCAHLDPFPSENAGPLMPGWGSRIWYGDALYEETEEKAVCLLAKNLVMDGGWL